MTPVQKVGIIAAVLAGCLVIFGALMLFFNSIATKGYVVDKYWTLTMYQYNFQSEYAVDYNLAFSCFVLASLPIVIFYFIMQKQIIGGLTNGAVKG